MTAADAKEDVMGTQRTFVLLVVDESTSMIGIAPGVRAGIDNYLSDLAADTARDYLVSMVVFSTHTRQLCSAVPVAAAPRLGADNYRPNGNTALLDAIGSTLINFESDIELGPQDRVLFVLATDGAENWSQHHSPGDILDMITEREGDGRWTFIHLAAGIEAADQGLTLGVRHVIASAQADLAREALYQTMGDFTRAWAAGTGAVPWTQLATRDLSDWPARVSPGAGHAERLMMEAELTSPDLTGGRR